LLIVFFVAIAGGGGRAEGAQAAAGDAQQGPQQGRGEFTHIQQYSSTSVYVDFNLRALYFEVHLKYYRHGFPQEYAKGVVELGFERKRLLAVLNKDLSKAEASTCAYTSTCIQYC
jgi:hypothetical protein